MEKTPYILANIHVIGGAYYQVKLFAVPQVGELIKLHSFVEQLARNTPLVIQYLEVVQIVHDIQDYTEKGTNLTDGSHFVNIFAKPIESEYFDKIS
jgi:hypothetical protein